jgi:hypothetical protein
MPAKRQNAKGAKQPPKSAAKIDWPGHWLKLAGHPLVAAPDDSCPLQVLACIKSQSGGQDLGGNPPIGKIGVDSGLLAACINDTFGTKYTKDDFPPTMRVIDVIHKVCG